MKKILMLLCCVSLLTACKNETKTDAANTEVAASELKEIQADFIYIQDAAVLKGQSFIYGVVLDDTSKELAKKVTPFKKDKYDMVPVHVKGIIKTNPVKDGWKEIVEIKEIIKVSPMATKQEPSPSQLKVSVNQ